MEHAEGVEERIVKKFISENCLELPINEHISAQGEVSIFRYFIDDEQGGQWKDGTITPYDHELQRWYRKPQAVKFFILGDEYNEPANKLELYKKTDELVQSGGSRSCMTPIFTTYNPKLKKMIICFPYFSEPFTKWIADYKGDGSVCLPGILKDMIRDLLVLMSKTSVMGLANPSSYICIRAKESPNNNNKYPNAGKREILKFIRFPLSGEDPNEHQMRTSFSAFLRTNLPREWLGRDFMLFMEMMETRGAVYSLQDVKEHPVLKCGDGITELIRACYRENLSPKQRGILDRIVNIANYGGQSWHTHLIVYPVLLAMSHYRTGLSDSYDLLWFSRKATAHYKENLNVALRSRTIQTCPFYNIHPSFIIMTLYPGLVSDLYKLYLNHEYLNAIV